MRIISGSHKGKRLTAPKNLPVRPTTDFAKEGLFNILRNQYDFSEIKVLDLFSGTGNISFEFASRGVPSITSVDAHFGCVKYIHQISEELNFPIDVVKSDVLKFLEKNKARYDIIFADPPYSLEVEDFKRIVELTFRNGLLAEDGLLIIEHPKHTDLSSIKNYSENRKYGGSVFSFFENK
ncbi:MAG: methyltransferase domain-containing protein [Flavobacteriaceae bacterium]|nr:methyltransferase domain-containing protein [Flavobacteriaceae bacterium]